MVDYIKEKYTNASPDPISLKQTEKVLEQMKSNSICRINDKGTGFFVKIPFKSKLLPVLITTNSVINRNDIQNKKNIVLYLNNNEKRKTIKLDNNRLKYSNEKFDITIIEIKEKEDSLNIKYLELDDEIINYFKLNQKSGQHYLINLYYNESIYLLDYPDDKNIFASYGKLFDINNTEIIHECHLKKGSSGSPILLINNQKLIGIHCFTSKQCKYNIGALLIYSIIEFSTIKNNLLLIDKQGRNMNHIYIIGEFNIEEEGKEIRIINSYEESNLENKFKDKEKENEKGISIINSYEESNLENKFKDNEKENEKEIKDNYEIIIFDKLIPFCYFYKFNKKGKYTITYKVKKNITKTNNMFSGCSCLTSIDLSNFNTDQVIDMSSMFSGCSSLKDINLTYFNTEKVIDMSNMFNGCKLLKDINLSCFNTNNVTNMSYMFNGCSSLTDINLFNFNTDKVFDMSNMFNGCKLLEDINLSCFNTNNVTNMSYMFSGCIYLKAIDLTYFNTYNTTNINSMFRECSSLKKINLSNFNTNQVIDMSNLFGVCSSLTEINLSSFNTNNVKNMNSMFGRCKSLTKIELSSFNTNNVTDMGHMFGGCSSLTNINLSNFYTNNVTDMSYMFNGCRSLTYLDLSNFNADNVNVKNLYHMFYRCRKISKNNFICKDENILRRFDARKSFF